MVRRNAVLAALMLIGSLANAAETLSFTEVWSQVRNSSATLAGSRLKVEASEEAVSRSERHWFPHVYLDAKGYRTNDPGATFFGLLEQRKVGNSDFAPDALNHPDSQTFTRGALGVDLPLYEGGMKKAQTEVFRHTAAAERLGASQIEVEQYGQTGAAYASIALFRKQKTQLRDLGAALSKLMGSYQLGQKSNPVGYSGLLGMKSVGNRINGLIEQLESQERAAFALLSELGVKRADWSPENVEAVAFAERFFPVAEGERGPSFRTLSGAAAVKASEQAAVMERSRFLPRLGAFGESYIFHGDRETANGYSAGLYLRWNLFDPADYGSYKEARLKAAAAQRLQEGAQKQESADRFALAAAISALRMNIARLDDSDRLLAEQTQVSATLFKNGSMSALQFVEILNRRTDLIAQKTEAEYALLKSATTLASMTSAGGNK